MTSLIRLFDEIGKTRIFNIINLTTSKKSLRTAIIEWSPEGYSVDVIGDNDDNFTIYVKKEDKGGKARIIRNDTIYLAISDESRDFIYNILLGFFNQYYPDISRIFYSSLELKKVLEELEEKTKWEIIADKIVAYKRIPEEKRKPKRREVAVTYTERPFREAFQAAIENDQWIDKIKFRLLKENKEELSGYLSREGMFRCQKNFSVFHETVLSDVAKIASEKIKLYGGRSRLEERKPKPVVIQFDFDIFKDRKQNRRLIDSLATLQFGSLSLYHSNPYVHLSLVDYLDGSSYDVWVLAFDKLTIVPQLRSSFASLARLLNHIFEKFGEGAVKDYEELEKLRASHE